MLKKRQGKGKYQTYRWCFVPNCSNTSVTAPDLLYIPVPVSHKERAHWYKIARRDGAPASGALWACEQHFDVPDDLENYLYVKMMGGAVKIKAGVTPHKFACQSRGVAAEHVLQKRSSLQRKRKLQELLAEPVDDAVPTEGGNLDSGPLPADGGTATDQHLPTSSDSPAACFKDASVQVHPVRKKFRSKATQAGLPLGCHDAQASGQHDLTVPSSMEHQVGVTSAAGHQKYKPKDPSSLASASASGKACSGSHYNADQDQNNDRTAILVSSPAANDTDTDSDGPITADTSPDYVPESESSDEDSHGGRDWKRLSRERIRHYIATDPMRYLGIGKHNMFVLNKIAQKLDFRESRGGITKLDIVFMILMRIRTDRQYHFLADDFGISESFVSRVISAYLPVVASCLRGCIRWPESSEIRKRVPLAFKARYPSVVSIIDCFEIEIEKPSAALPQATSWSEYKKCNTIKFLVSCTPDGLCNFLSRGVSGRTSDIDIVTKTGFLELLPSGCTVLADRGFKGIEGALASKNCCLVRPPSVACDVSLDRADVLKMRTIAGLRIHVERVIGRLRVFKALDIHSRFPLQMVDLLDDAVAIGCGLINLQEKIVKV
ncbi:uncharacterized protein LOC122363222 [Amphibalanus amphitrite]|uniref:uncharacterized protein LOC122363222 n=2 Tax=Amphibalanus amphitrite TaxID=1232801 RepID=UPI001C90597D|nr:uncharacterized protein LOC122363222 [Amphibalanus amphitrite]